LQAVVLVRVLKWWTRAIERMGRDVWTECEEAEGLEAFERAVNRCGRKHRGGKGNAAGLFNRLSTGQAAV
jgi:hypothetical protein